MPKIAKERVEESQLRIQAAALKLFTTQGFHGTNIREIASTIGISTGRIYTYYPSKEAIFKDLAAKYRLDEESWLLQAVSRLEDPFSEAELLLLASEIRTKVRANREFLLLIFIDVIEFKNQHFSQTFADVPARFRRLLGPALNRVKKRPDWRGGDPAFALAAIYLYFFTYFVTEEFILGRRYLGISDERAIERLIRLLFRGLWHGGPAQNRPRTTLEEQTVLLKAARDQVSLIRLLSGRLLSPVMDSGNNGAGGANSKRIQRQPILFEPRITKAGIDENRLRIEAAALELFTTRGFHGANLLGIAEKAGMSQAAIYSYYSSKLAIFESLVKSYRSCLHRFRNGALQALHAPFSRGEITFLAAAMESMVYDDAEYFLLMFIDVIEFGSRYFVDTFRDLPEQFRGLLGPVLDDTHKQSGWCGEDPALMFAFVYTCFFSYFHMERLMSRRHMGVSDEEAIARWIDILMFGLWTS